MLFHAHVIHEGISNITIATHLEASCYAFYLNSLYGFDRSDEVGCTRGDCDTGPGVDNQWEHIWADRSWVVMVGSFKRCQL